MQTENALARTICFTHQTAISYIMKTFFTANMSCLYQLMGCLYQLDS